MTEGRVRKTSLLGQSEERRKGYSAELSIKQVLAIRLLWNASLDRRCDFTTEIREISAHGCY